MINGRNLVLVLMGTLFIKAATCDYTLAQHQAVSPPAGNQQPFEAREKGVPYLRNYSDKEYGAFVQNWAVLQDQQGRMYFGNGHGVLTYNGVAWRLIETPDKSIVRSLAMDASGRIYAGAADDLGYLAPDSLGKLTFHSLLTYLPPQDRHFADVWKVHATPEGVYFQTDQYLFRWTNQRFKQWKASSSFDRSFWVDGRLFVQDQQRGLLEMRNESLQSVPQGEKLAGKKVQTILALDHQLFLVGTRQDGLYLYQDTSLVPFPAEINAFLKKNQLYQAVALADGRYALATLRGGLAVIDKQGRLSELMNKAKGLPTNTIYSAGTDHQGGCWLAHDKGISRVELASPFSAYGEANGLEGAVNAMVRHQGKLYAATSMGLFRLAVPTPEQFATGETARFTALPGFSEACWSLFSDGETLLVAAEQGVGQLKNDYLTWLNPYRCNTMVRSRKDTTRIFVALEDGLASLRWDGRTWKDEGKFEGIREEVHSVTETGDGKLWLSTFWQGIVRLTFPSANANLRPVPAVERLGQTQGLPAGFVRVRVIGGEALVGMDDVYQLYRFDEAKHRFQFVSNREFAQRFGLKEPEAYPYRDESPSGAVWLRAKGSADKKWRRVLAVPQSNGTYQLRRFQLDRMTENVGRTFYPESDDYVWYGGPDGIVRHDLTLAKHDTTAFQTLLERIVVNRDSLVYPSITTTPFDYQYNSLRFEFGAPSYDYEKGNEFQFRLEGYDEDWSAWGQEPFREYTRIPEGNYAFVVRARNTYGQVGKPATYQFRILPPWYKTWPMYGLYACLLGSLCFALVRWRSAQLRARNRELEQLIHERTREIALKNQQLEQQAGQLESQTEQLRELDQAKSNFFANISHEFRTPLTLILGSLSDKLGWFRQQPQTPEAPIRQTEVKVMYRNAQRLLQLINQLLDLSKVESGKLELKPRDGNLKQLLAVVTASFSSLAEFHRIRFYSVLPAEPLWCRFDADQVEKICFNLLSNAFKFTPDGGQISLKAELLADGQPEKAWVQITVQDSGPGIPADQWEKVFNRFYQGDAQFQSDQQGTGIGLALTKELVQLHGGSIRVESQLGQGACFIVRLPFVKALTASISSVISSGSWPDAHTAPHGEEEAVPLAATSDGLTSETILPDENQSWPVLLIVEDNADLRQYIRSHVERQYRVLESENGVQGWETALAELPDLIISDWMMPGMNGIELCQRIKTDERTSHIPFLLLTALATKEGKMTGLETGADEYLTKPFDALELQLRIRNLIESRRQLRERFSREIRVQPTDIAVTSADEQFLQRVMRIVEQHMGNPEFGAEQFGREVGLSRMQLHRKLTTLTGQSAGDFIRVMRLKRAAQLLQAQSASVSEIAYEVGFNTLFYFSKCFREQFGIAPSEYRDRAAAPSK